MIIDFRVRPPFKGYLKDYLYTDIENIDQYLSPKYGARASASALHRSLEELVQEMAQLDVVKACVPIRRADNQESTNKDLIDLLQLYPEQFIGMAGLDVQDTITALQEIEYYVVQGPCKGVLLEPSIYKNQRALYANDKEKMYPLYEKLEKEDILTAITFGGLGSPDATYYMPQVIDQVVRDFPKLRVVACHGGWPWVTQICALAFERENLYICPDIYQLNVPGCQEYVQAANYILQEKILYGTTYPLISMKDGIQCYQNSGFKPDVLKKVLYHNAARLLDLE